MIDSFTGCSSEEEHLTWAQEAGISKFPTPIVMSDSQFLLRTAFKRGYRADKLGNVVGTRGNLLSLRKGSSGYLVFSIKRPDRRTTAIIPVHRFVAYQKFGEYLFEVGLEVRHLNSNHLDNSWGNIALGSASDNAMDKPAELRKAIAKKAAARLRKLSDAEHTELILDREKGMSYRELEAKYKLSKSTISYIINQKTYKED